MNRYIRYDGVTYSHMYVNPRYALNTSVQEPAGPNLTPVTQNHTKLVCPAIPKPDWSVRVLINISQQPCQWKKQNKNKQKKENKPPQV